jgi:hypothetical protein
VPIITLSLVRSSSPGCETLRDAEVGEQHAAVGGDEDVARLDVAVHEAGAVRLVERTGDRGADVDRELGAEALLGVEQLAQALAVDELHHDGLAALVDEHVVDGDDVGVAQRATAIASRRNRSATTGSLARLVLQPLDRDLAVEVDVGGDPDLGHAALPDAAIEPVAAREETARVGACTGRHCPGG